MLPKMVDALLVGICSICGGEVRVLESIVGIFREEMHQRDNHESSQSPVEESRGGETRKIGDL